MSDIPFIRFVLIFLVGIFWGVVVVFVSFLFQMRHSKCKIERNEEVTAKCHSKVNEKKYNGRVKL